MRCRSSCPTGALTDTASSSDSLGGVWVASGVLSDSVASTDAFAALAVMTGALSDSVTTADAIGFPLYGSLTDRVVTSDRLSQPLAPAERLLVSLAGSVRVVASVPSNRSLSS